VPRGQADFGMYAVKETVGSLADMAELAARLGSLVTLDRRGDVVFLDDFEAPILNWTTGEGTGADIERLDPDNAYMGSQSLAMETIATTDAFALAERRIQVTPDQRYGLEARFQRVGITAYYDICIWIYDGTHSRKAELRYDRVNNEVQILDSTGNFKAVVTGIKLPHGYFEFWPAKLVIDSKTMKYVRGIFAGVEYDLSDEALAEDDSVILPSISIALRVTTAIDFTAGARFDNVIVTQNEP